MQNLHRFLGVSSLLFALLLNLPGALLAQECENLCITFGDSEVKEGTVVFPVILSTTDGAPTIDLSFLQLSVRMADDQDIEFSDIVETEHTTLAAANQFANGTIGTPFIINDGILFYQFDAANAVQLASGDIVFHMVVELPLLELLEFGYAAITIAGNEGPCILQTNCISCEAEGNADPFPNDCGFEIIETRTPQGLINIVILHNGEPVPQYSRDCCLSWEGFDLFTPQDCDRNPGTFGPNFNDFSYDEGTEYCVFMTCGGCSEPVYCGALGDLVEEEGGLVPICGQVVSLPPQICGDTPGIGISDVTITVNDANGVVCQTTTDINGRYECLVPSGMDYTVAALKEGNIACGIEEIDIARLQDHIQDVERLTTWRELFAADATGNNTISTWDQIYVEGFLSGNPIANSQPWRFFVTDDYAMQTGGTPSTPLPSVLQQYTFTNLQANQTNIDFIGIKIGDLDGNCTDCNGSESGNRSSIGATQIQSNRPAELSVVPNPFSNQTTLHFNLQKESPVQIEILNSQGQQMIQHQATYSAGMNEWTWQPSVNIASGVYWYKIQVNGQVYSGKMLKH